MQIAAFIILAVFYGTYFTKLLIQRKQGIKTNLLGKGKRGLVKFIEITLKIVTYIVPVAEVISICAWYDFNVYIRSPIIKSNWLRGLGLVFGVSGTAIFIISVITMRDSWRAGVPQNECTKLVTDGIYRYSRNPAFLGFDLVYLGILFMFFNWFLCAVTLLAGLMLHLQIINVEEDYLIKAFGDEYMEYSKTVCRYFGRKNRK